MSVKDTQAGGDHYKTLTIQPIEIIRQNGLDFFTGSALKYLLRYKRKHSTADKQIEDLRKAQQFIDFIIEELEQGVENVTDR